VRRLAIGLVVLSCAGCGSVAGNSALPTTPASSQSASPTREASPSASPSSQPTTEAAWKLPVATSSGGNTATAGFISLPDGTFYPDHQGDLANNSVGSPPLTGTSPRTNFAMFPTYDLPQHRWVPVSLQQLTHDGGQYAYAEWVMPTAPANGPTPPTAIRIHVVDVSAAVDRIVFATSKQLLSVVAFLPDGIYVTDQCWEGCGGVGGMWLLNPSTGQLKTILGSDSDHTDWRWISNGVAWGTGPSGDSNVLRLDIATGSVTPWFTPPQSAALIGADSQGFPLVETQDPYTGAVELWDEDKSTSGTRIFASPTVVHFSAPYSGACGTWIASTVGLHELTSSGVLPPLATTLVVQPAGLVVAGPCVPI
jgi:hypothetical protein